MALPLTPMPTFAPYLVVHTKSDCEWCATAKAFLDQHQLFYRVAAHDDEQERRSCRLTYYPARPWCLIWRT
jgi:hypothetical protein